jgi:HSP20 family protein
MRIPSKPSSRFSGLWRTGFLSDWLGNATTGTGAYPLINVFQRGEDLVIIELTGVDRSELNIQAKENTIRVAGRRRVCQ